MCLPINWTGKPGEFWVLSANVDDGGLFDGWGRRVVKFPSDGHPDMANAVLDITGDAREEIVVWDPTEMWVYTQDDSLINQPLFTATKNPLYNYSNYQTTVSIPITPTQQAYEAIDTHQFLDSIGHWMKKYGRDRKDSRYAPEQIVEIAENLLRYQNEDGGWPKDLDWLGNIDESIVRTLRDERSMARSTFDNHGTFPQVEYLAKVYLQTGDERHRLASERGLDYMLHEQRPSGGWRGSDVDAITFNDGTMTGILRVLGDINNDAAHFSWLDDTRCQAAAEAFEKGLECILACQIVLDGVKTAWCQQHAHNTFAPVKARAYELASITASESVSVVNFLMSIPNPDVRIQEAVHAAVAWMESSKIEGIRIDTISIDPVRFKNQTTTTDKVVVADNNAPPLWTRYYDLETNEPFFCRRDGTRVETFAEVDLERRTGYAWYGGWPAGILEKEYPAWLKRINRS